MEKIYFAARVLTTRPNRDMLAALPVALRAGLHAFERANRGHRHLLGELSGPHRVPPRLRAHGATLSTSLGMLTRGLRQTADQPLPDTKAVNDFLDAEDSGDWLRDDYNAAIGIFLDYAMHLPKGFSCRFGSSNLLKFIHDEKGLEAHRKINLTYAGPSSPRQYRENWTVAQRAVNALVKDIESWPEFADEAYQKALSLKTRRRLQEFIDSCTPASRQFLVDNWESLKPPASQ